MPRYHYDKFPCVPVTGADDACVSGWEAIGARLRATVQARGSARTVLTVECYPGVLETEALEQLARELKPQVVIRAWEALKSEPEINQLCEPYLGGNDPVFGYLSSLNLPEFFSLDKLTAFYLQLQMATGLVLVVGTGASLIAPGDVLVYADLARWEIQQRQRRKVIGNLGVANSHEPAGMKYKRAFFVDWRVADRWKKPLLGRMDFLLDTNNLREPKLAEGEAIR
ncbi:MAG TPA: mannose-6-phosphate isomerase, partial [Bacillota bacterium]|nr:mannose-6-phosphate isomerase [Bacillota bacterium]